MRGVSKIWDRCLRPPFRHFREHSTENGGLTCPATPRIRAGTRRPRCAAQPRRPVPSLEKPAGGLAQGRPRRSPTVLRMWRETDGTARRAGPMVPPDLNAHIPDLGARSTLHVPDPQSRDSRCQKPEGQGDVATGKGNRRVLSAPLRKRFAYFAAPTAHGFDLWFNRDVTCIGQSVSDDSIPCPFERGRMIRYQTGPLPGSAE